jgi:acetyltransferase-like isoleucine patch superfamily enzyme|tara:strand:+ start:34 stop:507 length:474 start_codon:yes stop_codon:yes gene_type:complete
MESKNFIHKTAEVSNKAKIGNNNYVWNNAQIREKVKIGNKNIISKDVYIDKNVKIGNNCKIQNSAQIYDGVTIKNNVFIGPGVIFTNDLFPRAVDKKWKIIKTSIENGASIGANSTILCGIRIGKKAMVAAGSVVIKDIKDFELHAGNPAKFKKKIK